MMRKFLSVVLLLSLCLGLFAGCGNQGSADTTTEPAPKNAATAEDIAKLESFYTGLQATYGDLHGHSASCSNSDGKKSVAEWKAHMTEKQIDFATIVDHSQTYHMMRDDWDPNMFLGGSEPGMNITGVKVQSVNNIDYSMIFTDLEKFEEVLKKYPVDYMYNETTGLFTKNRIKKDREQVKELFHTVKDNGGMIIYVHPYHFTEYGGYYDPVDVMDRWLDDKIGFEVYNQIAESYDPKQNTDAYDGWVTLINGGAQMWATHGSDCHSELPHIISLNTFYTADKSANSGFELLKTGNFTAGPVGIRTIVGDTVTGSKGSFEGKRVVMAVGDFHPQIVEDGHTYRVDVYGGTDLIFSQELSTTEMNYFAFDADTSKQLYRADVVDATTGKMIATGNPVWNG